MAVLDRHAQHFGDDGRRQRQRIVADQVHASPCLHRVEQLVGQPLDALAHVLDQPRRECLVHQPRSRVCSGASVSSMLRSIGLSMLGIQGSLAICSGVRALPLVLDEAVILEHGDHVFVASHQPGGPFVTQDDAVDGRLRRSCA